MTMAAAAALFGGVLAAGALAQIKVNGREIPQSRIDALVKSQVAQGRPDTPELRNAVKDELVNRELFAQEAQRRGLDKHSEVANQIAYARQGILVSALLQEYMKTNPVNDDAMKKEYERVKPQIPAKEYKAHHILVDKEDDAKGLIAQIRKGASFEKLASERSKDQGSKGKGGELDWSPAERYVKPFGDALAKLKKGQVTEAPVQTQFGWHVIRLDDERATKMPTFDEVKPQIQQMLHNQMVQKLIAELRAKAKIE
ncbi:MAG: peptidylprolyl isomerase [Burkholderiales bacterium]|nr:peptidylprolyl isomerase [Burkholderiales bacterium]